MASAKKYKHKPYFLKTLQSFERNVRHLRGALNLTVEEAAQRSGIHWRHWQKIEAGPSNVTLVTIVRLAKALEVEPDALIGSELPAVPAVSASKQSERK